MGLQHRGLIRRIDQRGQKQEKSTDYNQQRAGGRDERPSPRRPSLFGRIGTRWLAAPRKGTARQDEYVRAALRATHDLMAALALAAHDVTGGTFHRESDGGI